MFCFGVDICAGNDIFVLFYTQFGSGILSGHILGNSCSLSLSYLLYVLIPDSHLVFPTLYSGLGFFPDCTGS